MLVKNVLILSAAAMPLASALRSEKRATGVYGWCDFTWANAHKVQNVQCGAGDLANDDHPVYALVSCIRLRKALQVFISNHNLVGIVL